MIVVRANLYRDRAEQARRKQPKVRLLAAAGVLLCALVISDFIQSRALAGLRRQLAASEQLAIQLAHDIEAATARDLELRGGTVHRDAILAFASQRVNWASVLARAFAAVPPTVELSTLEVEANDPTKPRARFAGRSTGMEPRLEADKCMLQITHAFASAGMPMSGRFVMLEDSQSALIGVENRKGTAEFIIEFTGNGGAHEN